MFTITKIAEDIQKESKGKIKKEDALKMAMKILAKIKNTKNKALLMKLIQRFIKIYMGKKK